MALTRLNSRLFLSRCINNAVLQKRTILSESFDLKMEWNDRLKAPLFSKVDMDKYFIDIDRQYMRDGLISHIDADVFVNSLLLSKQFGQISSSHDIETRFEQMEEVLRRFRNSPETNKMLGMRFHTKCLKYQCLVTRICRLILKRLLYLISFLDSTSHAVVRCSVEVSQTDTLMRLLNNRLKFGLFLDDYTYIFLLNYFLKKDNFRDASKTAILMMHQEEYDVPIAKELGMISNKMSKMAIFGHISI